MGIFTSRLFFHNFRSFLVSWASVLSRDNLYLVARQCGFFVSFSRQFCDFLEIKEKPNSSFSWQLRGDWIHSQIEWVKIRKWVTVVISVIGINMLFLCSCFSGPFLILSTWFCSRPGEEFQDLCGSWQSKRPWYSQQWHQVSVSQFTFNISFRIYLLSSLGG